MQVVKEWYRDWFNSPYYDILYKERDQEEADIFIYNIVNCLSPKPESKILDLACGKGRFSIALNKLGFNVTGVDLSEKNIAFARKYENKKLSFILHDMRWNFLEGYFDFVFNLFTSFGYFEKEEENRKVLSNIYSSLNPNGILVLDYFNAEKVIHSIIPYEDKVIENILFKVRKHIENGHLIKDIEVTDEGRKTTFEEKIKLYSHQTLKKALEKSGFEILNTLGDYRLNPFIQNTSERMIFLAKKASNL